METINRFLEKIDGETHISLEEIPAIDLYMDQVIQLFENKYGSTKRNEKEKILTKTMINNYAKGKLLFPIKNKKYSKEHLILISMIYQLKGALSINDIHDTLAAVNNRAATGEIDLETFYRDFLDLCERSKGNFLKDLEEKKRDTEEKVRMADEENQDELKELEKILMIASLAYASNLYRRAAEALVDDLVKK